MSRGMLDKGKGSVRGTGCGRERESGCRWEWGTSGNGREDSMRGHPDKPGPAGWGLLGHCQDIGVYPQAS